MAYIMIEPKNIHSMKSAQRIVGLLRKDLHIRRYSIISIVVNGFNEYSVIVSTDDDFVKSRVCSTLNGNQDEYNFYNDNWPTPY